jgi:type II restriction/modification system DNA methylase subunit YeeA
MLTYAFDLLVLIYEEEGYSPNEIPGLILEHNLHGLEICPRAAQLAELALVFKAREQSRRFFQPEQLVRPQIIELQDVQFKDGELNDYIDALDLGELFDPNLFKLLHQFEEAKTFGSLIKPCLDERAIANVRLAIEAKDLGGQLLLRETHLKVLRVLEQAEALTQRYQVVVANPPYMGSKGMNGRIRQFLLDNYEEYKSDLFAAFIVRSKELAVDSGCLGFMSPFVWMFISSYEKLRLNLINQSTITSLIHLEYSGFEGATVPICTFAFKNNLDSEFKGSYIRLCDFRGPRLQEPKTLEAIDNPSCGWFYRASSSLFRKIPGCPLAYWISKPVAYTFENSLPISRLSKTRRGLQTGEGPKFVREWFECALSNTALGPPLPGKMTPL